MENKLQTALINFPKRKNGELSLRKIVEERIKKLSLTAEQKERLNFELAVIEKTETEKVFLEFVDTVYALKELGAFCGGLANSSYLCYLLGITKVNPLRYGLYFERFFNEKRARLPYFTLFVGNGQRGRAMEYFSERYGFERIACVKDSDDVVVSSKPIGFFADTEAFLKSDKEKVWKECALSLSSEEVTNLGLYTFTLREGEAEEGKVFTDEDICFWARLTYKRHGSSKEAYGMLTLTEMGEIFKTFRGGLLFQEQFYSLCEELLKVEPTLADEWRLSICKRKRREVEKIKGYFFAQLGEKGEDLFQYIYNKLPYTVCKAYVVGEMLIKNIK